MVSVAVRFAKDTSAAATVAHVPPETVKARRNWLVQVVPAMVLTTPEVVITRPVPTPKVALVAYSVVAVRAVEEALVAVRRDSVLLQSNAALSVNISLVPMKGIRPAVNASLYNPPETVRAVEDA